MPKTVIITIPDDGELPKIVSSFTPEKVLLALNIGCRCIEESEQSLLGLTQESIYNKIKEETRGQMEKMEMDLIMEKETTKKMEERIIKIYEGQMEQL